ncbi:MAG: aldehyde dehydrogenase family protein [Nitrospiraceae bacterium]|nr:MAG: aldehyde dehydrogenase family protein [Nitrospiraceae bacterium]
MAAMTVQVAAPYDRHLIREVPLASYDEVSTVLDRARDLFHDRRRWLPKYERIRILRNFRDLLAEGREGLARQAAEEGGKPLADSLTEVNRAVNGVDVAIHELTRIGGSEIPMELTESSKNHIAYTMMEPAGVVFAVSAFNHPVNLIIHQVIPAVAAGCPVIVKPAAATPLSCLSLTDMLHQAGLPADWCRAVLCEREVTQRVTADSRIAFLSFIGSAKVGWKLRSNLAPGVRCSLEHGGAAPVIVEPDADIDAMLPGLVKGGYYHAGQVCVSVQRLFVHRKIMPELRDRMTELVRKLRVGDPLDVATEVGPLIKPAELNRVEGWVEEAVRGGAQLLCGGRRISDTCYEPALLLEPPLQSKCSQEEVFGPVVCLYEYDDYLDAVDRANRVPFSFQASVYTASLDRALDCVRRLKAKTVLVNEHTAFRVDWMPFGGAEMSGLGTGGIGYAMRDMCSEKLMIIRSGVL